MEKASKADKEKCRIVTPTFRVSYPHVFKPSVMKGTNNAPKYSVTMLFDKDDDISTLKAAIKQAKIVAFGSKENWPDSIQSPVDDGDSAKHAAKEGYKGHWAIKASTGEDNKPGVVDEHGRLIEDVTKFYPGCYARAYVYAYVWEFPKGSGKYGIGFILDHVQKMKDGASFGGKKPISQVFGPVGGAAMGNDDEDNDDSFDFR